jgi:phospholipid transport system substrate-binding protein
MAAGLLAVAPVAQGAGAEDAQALVKSTADKVLVRLKQDRARLQAKPDLIYPLVEDLVLPHFDFEKMSQWVLGPAWRTATPEQRQRFTAEFRNLLVRTYAKALLEYTDQTLNYLPVQAEAGADKVVVKTQIVQKGSSYPIGIDYAMYQKNGQWKVYDLAVDNVSLVSNYRKSFASDLRQGTLDQLIARLETMNKQGTEKGG